MRTDKHFSDVNDNVRDGHRVTQRERQERGFDALEDRLADYVPLGLDRPKGEHYGA